MPFCRAALWHKVWATAITTVLVCAALGMASMAAAWADTAPADPTAVTTPPTVSADALPTVQINGVVWAQATVGNVVYVGGKFTSARPAGAPAGTGEVTRNNLLAYDITTGKLITSFAPNLNAQVLAVAASPDGSRIYVGGDFTTADGQPRSRIAAYDTATGQLVTSFHPSVGGRIKGIAATNTQVYAGGAIYAVSGVSRTKLAAFSAANGALLPWAPVPAANPDTSINTNKNTATSADVEAVTIANAGGGQEIVVAGHFWYMNGAIGGGGLSTGTTGVAALPMDDGTANSGKTNLPFAVGGLITNEGANSAILSLNTSADGNVVYGSGYDYYGPGNLEGSFAANAAGGTVISFNDCHGDTYSTFPMGPVVYLASHEHDCADIVNGFPQQTPAVFARASAITTAAAGVVGTHTVGNGGLTGQPSAAMLDWFPTLQPGTVTGQVQAAWSVSGNGQYVTYGGEFPTVNGVAQQGLVRFAVPTLAPNQSGPRYNAQMTPSVRSAVPGTASLSWQATWDMDNQDLTYRVYRDGDTTTPVHEATQASTWWNLPTMSYSDMSVSGGTHTYRVTATDPFGNVAATPWASVDVTAGTGGPLGYAQTVLLDGAQDYWRLGETSGTTAADAIGGAPMQVQGTTLGMGQPGALVGDPDTAFRFYGQSGSAGVGYLATQTAVPGPNVFTLEAWFQTTSTTGGKIVGFGNQPTGNSTQYDRHIFMDQAGHLYFGVYPGDLRYVGTSGTYNDGHWHHVAATLSPAGMALYVDGAPAGSRSDTTTAQPYNGYWRVGGDSSWAGAGYFTGLIDDVAVYPTALTADQIAAHHTLGGGGTLPNQAPTAAFSSSVSGLSVSVDGSGSADADGSVASYAWDFGDGSTGTGVSASHAYAAGGTYSVRLTVTDNQGAPGSVTHQVTVTAPAPAPDPQPAPFASDGFARTVSSGFGTADVGGKWSATGVSGASSVSGGQGHIRLAKAGTKSGNYLTSVSATDVATQASVSLPTMPTGGGVYFSLAARHAGTTDYRVLLVVNPSGSANLGLSAVVSGQETKLKTVAVPGLTYTAGTVLLVRFDVTGTGTASLGAKVWVSGTPEPAAWQVTGTDSTAALQGPGGVGLEVYVSGAATALPAAVDVDDFWSGAPQSSPPSGGLVLAPAAALGGSGRADGGLFTPLAVRRPEESPA